MIFLIFEMELPKDWRFYARYIGLGLITASVVYWFWMRK